ncbi:MAG TPA: efflux RND transporter periplasmic adaptor subunit [bacterium]|nr:efflux RND transporter periplasmic adaptor subunit [bacterium]
MNKRRIILGMIILVIILIIVGRMVTSKREARTDSVEEGVPVEVVKVIKEDFKETISYTGDIEAKERIEIYPRVSGKIIKKNVVEGDRIKKRQTIALIDRDEPGFKFEPAPVDSLLGGIVGRVYVDLGAKVTPQTPVALIVDMDRVKIKIDVVERDLPKIKIGQEAQIKVDAYPEKVFTGKVWKISPVVNIESRTAPIETLISNPKHLLKPGMFARVEITTKESKDTFIIPRDALMKEEDSTFVFIVKDNRALRKEVTTGMSEENLVEIKDNLNAGEEVIVMGKTRVKDGDLVRVIRQISDR